MENRLLHLPATKPRTNFDIFQGGGKKKERNGRTSTANASLESLVVDRNFDARRKEEKREEEEEHREITLSLCLDARHATREFSAAERGRQSREGSEPRWRVRRAATSIVDRSKGNCGTPSSSRQRTTRATCSPRLAPPPGGRFLRQRNFLRRESIIQLGSSLSFIPYAPAVLIGRALSEFLNEQTKKNPGQSILRVETIVRRNEVPSETCRQFLAIKWYQGLNY